MIIFFFFVALSSSNTSSAIQIKLIISGSSFNHFIVVHLLMKLLVVQHNKTNDKQYQLFVLAMFSILLMMPSDWWKRLTIKIVCLHTNIISLEEFILWILVVMRQKHLLLHRQSMLPYYVIGLMHTYTMHELVFFFLQRITKSNPENDQKPKTKK